MVQLARNKDWTALWNVGEETVKAYYEALCRFFEKDIQVGSDGEPVDFTWGIYKKASQLCYSLCTEILAGVGDGVYPVSYTHLLLRPDTAFDNGLTRRPVDRLYEDTLHSFH